MRPAVRWLLPVALAGFFLGLDVVLVEQGPASELAVEMQSSEASQAKVYFDTGSGFNERESATQSVPADSASHLLLFPLPEKAVRSIRFDPLEIGGVVQIRAAAIQKPHSRARVRELDLTKIVALNEIQSLAPKPAGLEIKIAEQARDPQLLLPLPKSVRVHHSTADFLTRHNSGVTGVFLALVLVAIGIAKWWDYVTQPIQAIDAVFARWLAAIKSTSGFPLDRAALWFYLLCLTAFLLLSLGKFHGSSISLAGASYRGWTDVEHVPLLGTPKKVRSDEWSFHTPTILNQIFRRNALPVRDTLLGPDKAALLGNVPCTHFTQIFRPQFWAFFVLPGDFAFSFYWQCKGVLVLTGVFTLVLLLTRSSLVAAICAFWYFLSAYTQWSYSWASLLPEMVGLFCWTIVLTCYLMVGRNRWGLLLAATVCAWSAISFALCAYPPHQLPLGLLGVALVAGWIWSQRALIFRRSDLTARLIFFLGAWLVVAAVMAAFYFDAKDTLVAAAGTIYPGQRSSSGGGIPPAQFLSHFLDFWKSEQNIPASQGNICEGSGYLWLAPLTLLLARPPREHRRFTALLICVWAAALLLLCWMVLPIPAEAGRWLLFNRVPPFRCYHALGLANVIIVGLVMLEQAGARGHFGLPRFRYLRGLGAAVLLMFLLVWMNRRLDHFFTSSAIALAGLFALGLVLLLIKGAPKAFAVCLLIPLLLANGLINPLDRGLDVITSSSLFKAAHGEHKDWLETKWIIYAPWADQPGLLAGTGIDVIDCLQIVPDRKRMALLDPDGRYSDVINRSAYFFARPISAGQPASFETPVSGVVLMHVNPLDPRLKEMGAARVAFAYQPPAAEFAAALGPLLEVRLPGLHIYRLR
jgi:hypothetical protein